MTETPFIIQDERQPGSVLHGVDDQTEEVGVGDAGDGNRMRVWHTA